jgi:PAS domain S-box-containing protein
MPERYINVRHHPLVRYAFAVMVVALATVLRWWLDRYFGTNMATFLTWYPAVLLVASIAGGGPGVLATILSAIVADYWFIQPHGFGVAHPADAVALGIFVGTGIFLSILAERLRRSRYAEAVSATQERESARFRTMADSIPQLAWIAKADGFIFWYNRRWYEYTGTAPQQMEGWGWQSVHDPSALPKVMEQWQASIATGKPFDMTFPLRGADGRFRPFLTRVQPMKDEHGTVLQWFGTNTDVDELKRVQDVATRLAAIVEFSEDAIISKSSDGIILTWNTGAQRMLGYQADEIVGQPITRLLPPDRLQEEAQIMQRLNRGEHIDHFETVRLAKDGRPVEVSATISPVKDSAGKVIGASKSLRDITERKLAEMENKRNELRLESLMRISQHGAGTIQELLDFALAEAIALTDSKIGYIYHYNENKKEFTLNTWSKGVMAECTIVEQQTIYKLEKTGAWGEAVRQAKPIVINDFHAPNPLMKGYPKGHSPLHKFMTVPVLSDGHIVGVVGVANKETDYDDADVRQLTLLMDSVWKITDRKRAEDALRENEQRLRTVLDSLPVAVFLSDKDGNVVFTNLAVERIWGISTHVTKDQYGQYKGAWVATGKPVEPRQWALARTLETGKPFTNDLVEIHAGEGKKKIIHNFAMPVRSESGQLTGAVVVTEDITERHHAHEQVRQAKEAAEQAARDLARSNQDLEQFAYVSSHDLQEPLRMVSAFMQMLEQKYKDNLDSEGTRYIHYAVDGARRMQSLINDLLAYSRVGSKGGQPAPTGCEHAMEQAMANLTVSLEDSKAHVTHGPLPTVTVDARQLSQLFQNLIGNAVKFRSGRPLEIHVDAKRDGAFWILGVSDNGIGMDPQYRERIFIIFQRLHPKEKYSGTGIGLAICKKIVERHGGQIWVESQLGKGSTFYFKLPAQ